jgi:Zn finger protein HypA/HybF involved in hydrogenase expression
VHDQHAVQELISRLSCLERVREVRVRAGVVFSPEALIQAYEMGKVGTPLEGSRLIVEEWREERMCAACGRTWQVSAEDVAGHVVLCPACGAPTPLADLAGLEIVGITWGSPDPLSNRPPRRAR